VINLHNHSTWSDGQYAPDQLVDMAIQSDLTHIGISDHFFTTKLFLDQAYVDVERLDAYIDDLHRVAGVFAEQIQVLAGIEVDWSDRARPKFPALWDKIGSLDYVLFEYVEDRDWYGDSLEALLTVRPSIPIPVGLAHNDLSRNMGPYYRVDELVSLLEEYDIFIELSTNPYTMYYKSSDADNRQLWRALAKSKVRFSIGSDTHGFIADVGYVRDACSFLRERGMIDRLITNWWDPDHRVWKPYVRSADVKSV